MGFNCREARMVQPSVAMRPEHRCATQGRSSGRLRSAEPSVIGCQCSVGQRELDAALLNCGFK